jgi:hypothetical protein
MASNIDIIPVFSKIGLAFLLAEPKGFFDCFVF